MSIECPVTCVNVFPGSGGITSDLPLLELSSLLEESFENCKSVEERLREQTLPIHGGDGTLTLRALWLPTACAFSAFDELA